jgi:hypothetical protein
MVTKIKPICLLFLLFGCKLKENNEVKKEKNIEHQTHSTTLNLNNTEFLNLVNNKQRENLANDPRNPFLKVIFYTNVSCSDCLYALGVWDSLHYKKEFNNVDIISVCYSKDNFRFFRYLNDEGEIPSKKLKYFLDTGNLIPKNNPIFSQKRVNPVVIADSSYRVIYTLQNQGTNKTIEDIKILLKNLIT